MELIILAAAAATAWWLIERQIAIKEAALERINETLKEALRK